MIVSEVVEKKDKKAKNNNSVPSILVHDLKIDGTLISKGSVELGGEVEGIIRCNNLVIRKEASIKGDIMANSLTVHGKVDGKILAKSIHIKESASIVAEIEYEVLNIESGTNIEGNMKKANFSDIDIFEIKK